VSFGLATELDRTAPIRRAAAKIAQFRRIIARDLRIHIASIVGAFPNALLTAAK